MPFCNDHYAYCSPLVSLIRADFFADTGGELALHDPAFTAALLTTKTTQEAVQLAADNNITVTPEALWRNRGTFMTGGRPTWRG